MCIGLNRLQMLQGRQPAQAPLQSLQISKQLPSLASLDAEIASLQTQVGRSRGRHRTLFQKILDEKLSLRKTILDPSVAQGIPPAPEGPGLVGPRIEASRVGVNDLKIPLPQA